MSPALRVSLNALTAVAWLVLALDALPIPLAFDDDAAMLAACTAVVGSFIIMKLRLDRDAHELFAAGKMVGRAQAEAEQNADDRVVSLDARRMLRLVGDDDADVSPG